MIELLVQKKKALQNTIEHIKATDFLEMDETDLVNSLVDKFKVDAPVIDFDNISISSYEQQIPAEQFPQGFFVRQGKSYSRQVVVYHLPFTGNDELFQFTPSQFMLWSPEVYIEDQNVCFEIVNFRGDTEEIKREAQRSIDAIKFFSNAMLQDVSSYDAQLQSNVEQLIIARKQRILNDNSLLTALGKPINKKHFAFGLSRGLDPLRVGSVAAPIEDDRKENDVEVRAEMIKEIAKEADTHQFPRRLRVFLCHSSGDKPRVRKLYKQLIAEGVDAWLDKEDLLPGQDWQPVIRKTIRNMDVVIVCLTQNSITKVGFVQKEIKLALDVADEQPEGTIFLIPVKLEKSDLPDRLKHLHTVNLFERHSFEKLMRALKSRSDDLGLTLTSV